MSEFFSQGGFGFYIWMSYGIGALLMIGELWLLRRQRKELLARHRRLMRLNSEESE